MGTISFSLSCDSLVAKMCNNICDYCQQKEAGTTIDDISKTSVIFEHIVLMVFIAASCFLLWKLIDHIAKGISGWNKRRWENKDKERKQKSDLLDKYIDFLKEQAKEKELVSIEDYEKLRKDYISHLEGLLKNEKDRTPANLVEMIIGFVNAVKQPKTVNDGFNKQKYIDTLERLIVMTQRGELKKITIEELRKKDEDKK